MPKNKSGSHERITLAAKREFLCCGFENASMRRIAADAGITVSGLYKHFPNKEEMFVSLVQPMLDEFYALYRRKESEEQNAIEKIGAAAAFLNDDAVYVMQFIYDHFDAFKLLVCCSQGTRYEDYTHRLAEMEEESSLRFIDTLRNRGDIVPEFDRREFHLLVSANVDAVLQPIRHDFSREDALHYAETINTFFAKGWKWLCGME